MNSHDTENDRTLQPGTAHPDLYDADAHTVVLSADHLSGFVAPQVLINHITQTKIYGDGRVVFLDPTLGSGKIFEGKLERKQLEQLFTLLKHKGFWGFAESYAVSGPADMPTSVITAKAHDRPEKRVNCYAGALSAPPGFIDCFQALSYPALKPSSVSSYQRVSISQAELAVAHQAVYTELPAAFAEQNGLLALQSRVTDHRQFLLRPDLGRSGRSRWPGC